MRRTRLFLLLALLAGCTAVAHNRLNDLYGEPNPTRYDTTRDVTASVSPAARASWEKTEGVLATRCAVCHACYDAPCQLKLTSHDGVTRGASKEQVYGMRLLAMSPTRLGVDAHSDVEWRKKGFYPVLNERRATPTADREGSVLHRLLDLKRKHAPETGILPASKYDFSLSRAQVCPTIEEMDEVEKNNSQLGMPFGMPNLTDAEYQTLSEWITSGAPYAPRPALAPAYVERVNAWEAFLNANSLKEQLMARYIYEHWYLAHLYFDDLPTTEYFSMVRSSTPPGQPVNVIPTTGPYEDPGVDRVYYRFVRVQEMLVAKTHMPYKLSAARLERMRTLFLKPDYTVTKLPSYDPDVASNPFVAFRDLPVQARYRLMLEEAQFTIMGFIKGPVCRGQVALNVITDYFWVTFADPTVADAEFSSGAMATALAQIRMPSADNALLPLAQWKNYARRETAFFKAKTETANRLFTGDHSPKLSQLWDGDGDNHNAALTIFRHFDSATVLQGLLGTSPQTAWIVGYPLLERIHYLLVAGYDVYSNTAHQVVTRMYMDFLRMEGESNFLMMLPLSARDEVRYHWYRGASKHVEEYIQGSKSSFTQETGIQYRTNKPLPELYAMLKSHMAPVLNHRHDLTTSGVSRLMRKNLDRLSGLHGLPVSHLPEVTMLTVTSPGAKRRHYTLVHNDAHANICTMFEEAETRLPGEDTVTLMEGFVGAYPNQFVEIPSTELNAFVDGVATLKGEPDYAALISRFGIRRTDARFWPHSDSLHAAYKASAPIEAAILDYNRYDNR